MENRFDKLFFKSDTSYKRDSMSKMNWRRYTLGLIFGAIAGGGLLAGIFFSAVFDSVASVLVLVLLAAISAMK
jgi:hypothetical protein